MYRFALRAARFFHHVEAGLREGARRDSNYPESFRAGLGTNVHY